MYAIVSTGGKQYRVERGQTLLVERLPVDEGKSCTLAPLLYVDGEQVLDSSQDGLSVRVEARVVAHERGPKLRVVKFKPKRGYKRRTGHRQELTRIEITAIEAGEARKGGGRAQRGESAQGGERAQRGESAEGGERPRRARAKKEGSGAGGRARRAPSRPKEESDGS